MSTAIPSTGLIPGFIRRYFNYILKSRLPSKTKRLIYISSILGVIETCKDPDQRLIAKLNEVFRIAKYQDSFLFPMQINQLIWPEVSNSIIDFDGKKIPLKNITQMNLSESELETIGKYFAKKSPPWLTYGSQRLMVADAASLISEVSKFRLVHA